MTNPPILVITGLGGYFILNFLQKSGFRLNPLVGYYISF
jgi:tRNA A22 N-methylase